MKRAHSTPRDSHRTNGFSEVQADCVSQERQACGVKHRLRLEEGLSKNFQAVQDPKPGSWQQVKDVISISRVQSLSLKQILGLSTLRQPFPISKFRKYIGALTLNSSLALLVMYIIGLNC